ncbi:MAG: hypothetical protein AAF639_24710, partial [Chloroflexota bacterium]
PIIGACTTTDFVEYQQTACGGLAIAWAVIEYIHNNPTLRAKTLFATHYHELTELAERLPHVVNYNVAVADNIGADNMGADNMGSGTNADGTKLQDVIFLRRIVPGRADRSYGVQVARMAGLPMPAVQRAEEILIDLEDSGAAGPSLLLDALTQSGDNHKKKKSNAMKVSLFADAHPAVEALRALDVNALSPLEALNRLYELQNMAKI